MRNHSWNKRVFGTVLYAFSALAAAQVPGNPAPAPARAIASATNEGADTLADALTCRIGRERYPLLMEQLRAERPQDFAQTYRQYSEPMMDEYRLLAPVRALGHDSDAIVIAPNRVMMAVAGSLEEVTTQLEHALAKESPLSGALDKRHGLVIYAATQAGLEGMVLLGCEYRIPKVSLLDNPSDAWRSKPTDPAPKPGP
ncbi:MAG TPA: hypothetical protein VIT22_04570 [Pseudoxanthomonas sp.]